MKKNNPNSGTVSKIRGYSPIETDFIDACKPYTSDMQKEDTRHYILAVALGIIAIIFLSINAIQTTEIKKVESLQSSPIFNAPVETAPIVITPPQTEILAQSHEVFVITAYCSCSKCCGKSDGITFSGVKAVEGVTVAADLNRFPLGTEIYIEGIGKRIVQDKGGAIKGNRIDVFFNDHKEALRFGLQERWVTYTDG